MKTKLATFMLATGLVGTALVWAQPAQAQEAAAPKAEAAEPAAPAELLPLVQFEDAALLDVIKTLARQAGVNVIFDPKVVQGAAPKQDGTGGYPAVSIRLENVTAENVLEAILNNNGLRLEKDAKTKISRITIKDPAAQEPLVTKIYQLKYGNPTNLVNIIKPTIGARSQVIADGRTSQMIVLATDKELVGIDDLVTRLDTATRQVLIEARLYETTRTPETAKGVNWAGTFQAQNIYAGNNAFASQNVRETSTGSTIVEQKTGTDPVNPPIAQGIAPSLNMFLRGGYISPVAYLNADGARAVFSFFNSDSESEVIATPRAVTTDNQPAILSVSQAVPIFKVTQGGTQTGNSVDITYTNLGVILEVTPRISANDTIALQVVPEVSDIARIDRQVIDGEAYTANVFGIRRINTHVSIPSGNTLVLGGLLSDTERQTSTKVPILGDLPGMKSVFGSKGKSLEKRNLLIFVTPTLVKDEDFRPTESEFLRQPLPKDADPKNAGSFDEPWDGTGAYDWGKPVY